MTTLVIESVSERHRGMDRPWYLVNRSWFSYAIVLVAVLAAFCIEHIVRPTPAFPYDDPYITLHSAQVLHAGFDAAYPGVPALFGVTSAPFLALIYLLLFIFPPLQALDISCWTGVVFYALGLVHLARVLELRPRRQWLFVFIGLASAPVPIHCLNGLETSCALASITWMLGFAAGNRRGWIPAAFFAGLTGSLRPDLLPLAFLVTAWLIWRTLRADPEIENKWLQALALAVISAAPVVLCGFWYFHATGSPLPSTGTAKRYFFAEDHWTLFHKVIEEASQTFVLIFATGPLVLAVPKMARLPLGKVLLAGMMLFALVLFLQFPGEFQINEFRYPVVLIPALLWGLGMTVKHLESFRPRLAERLMRICALYAACMLPLCFYLYKGERRSFEMGTRQLATWCQDHVAPGTPLLVHDAGYLAYTGKFRLIDFIGLKTPSSIPINRQYTWPTAGKERALAVSKIAAESGSKYMILKVRWDPVSSLPEELRALGWGVEPSYATDEWKIFLLTPPKA